MFDLAAGTLDRPLRDQHRGAAVTSLAAHAVVLGTIGAALLLATGAIPQVQRAPMMAFVVSEPPPPIPAAPRPAPPAAEKPRAAAAARAPLHPVSPGAFLPPPDAAPIVAPAGVAPERDGAVATRGSGYGEGAGGEGGSAIAGLLGGIEGVPLAPPPPPPPLPVKPVRVGGQIAAPTLVTRVEPVYPPFAVSAHVEGVVILEAMVDEAGLVQSVRVLRGHPVLDDAAMEAVKQWRYSPVLVDGRPVPFLLTVTVTFRLQHGAR